jgi:hypothetical protein
MKETERFTYGAFAYTLFKELDSVKDFITKRNVCANAKLKDLGGGLSSFPPNTNY